MVFDFDIKFFKEDQETLKLYVDNAFTFYNNSVFSDLTFGTLTLRIYYPTIDENTYHDLKLISSPQGEKDILIDEYQKEAVVLGTSYDIPFFNDGIYRFDQIAVGQNEEEYIKTKYFLKYSSLLDCRKRLMLRYLKGNDCESCLLSVFDTMLGIMKEEVEKGNYQEGQEIFNYLNNKCNNCNYGC